MDGTDARAAGAVCAVTPTADVVDASVAIVAAAVPPGERTQLLTSDEHDLSRLLDALRADNVDVVHT